MSSVEFRDCPLTYTEFLYEDTESRLDLPVLSDTVIILGNHLASSVFKADGELNDAGRKARGVAMRTGYPVIAYDHLGTSPGAPELIVDTHNFNEVIQSTGQKLGEIIADRGFRHVILGGNSGDAAIAACLAASETMPVSHLAAMDPVAMHTIHISRAFPRYLRHTLREERKAPKPPRPPDDLEEEATGFDPRAFRRDSKAYRRVWDSCLAGDALRTIASSMGDVAVRLEIPNHTFTGGLEQNRQFMRELSDARSSLAVAEPGASPLQAVEIEGYHSSFENFRAYARCIARVIHPDFSDFEY